MNLGRPDDTRPKPGSWFADGITFARAVLADPAARLLVACVAGVNRGPSMAYAILRDQGHSGAEAVALLRRARPAVNLSYAADYDVANGEPRPARPIPPEEPSVGWRFWSDAVRLPDGDVDPGQPGRDAPLLAVDLVGPGYEYARLAVERPGPPGPLPRS